MRSPWPNTRSWSYLMPRWPLRSMWKSLPCHSAWAMPAAKFSPAICSWPTSGFTPDELGVLEARDERDRVADGRQQDVAARLVGLGLDREADVVAPVDDELGEHVHRLGVAVERGAHVLGLVVLRALAPAPQDERPRAELGGELEVAQHLAQRVAAHAAVVAGEPAVLEHRVGEQVGGDHRHGHAVVGELLAEAVDDRVAVGGRAAERHEVVVVERDAPCAEPTPAARPRPAGRAVRGWGRRTGHGRSSRPSRGRTRTGRRAWAQGARASRSPIA